MPLKPCYECSNQISPKATICPQCGAPQKKGLLSKQVLYSLALIYSVLFWYFFHPFGPGDGLVLLRGPGLVLPILFVVYFILGALPYGTSFTLQAGANSHC